jgi:two-component system NtrC family sensor kinase
MSSDHISRTSSAQTKGSASPGGNDFERFRRLSYELLKYSTQGFLRKDFLPKISETIREYSGCDATELWVKEGSDKHFRCSVTKSNRMPFGFILVPCPLGEETDPPLDNPDTFRMEQLCCDIINGTADSSRARITERGSCWIGAAAGEDRGYRDSPVPAPAGPVSSYYHSIAIIPIRLEEECIGLLQLKSRKHGFFSLRQIAFFEDISTVFGVAVSHQYTQIELRERIKEITCLYGIARVIAQPEAPFDHIIQGIVNLLPPAWLYPEVTCAQIVLDGRSYATAGFRETPYRQVSDIIVDNNNVGFVAVVYLEKKLTLDEGPFLVEERSLINSVAREVAIFYERSRAEAEKESLQEQLRHADRLATIGQLAAGVAHELNEPLGNILGFAQLAKKSPDLTDQLATDLNYIESASLSAREIIKKLMTFARQLPPKKAPRDLNKMIQDSLSFFEARCVKADIRLVTRFADALPEIIVDPGQINQVLVNLVVNAMQAMPEGGTLNVETRNSDRGITIDVADTGTGMTEDLKKQIFLPFFTTKDINEGTGLGLAVVHGIVTSHGGNISVESEVGKGTRFHIWLPLVQPDRHSEEQK